MLRRRFVFPVLLLLAALGIGGIAYSQLETGDRGILPLDSSGTLEIGGIHVDVGGKDAETARYSGWRIAQRQGFRALWAKMHKASINDAPNLPDSTLDDIVSSINVEAEQIGPNRYIADLGILFDRARAGELLGVAGQIRRSAPMLLIPVLISGGSAMTVEIKNPWQRAWAQFRTSQSPVDYVRISGMGVDPLLVNAAQTKRPGRGWWRNIIDLYGAADILIAEVSVQRLYPGGPAYARFVGRHGPDGEIIGGFDLRAKDSADIPRMMAEGVQRMDELFTRALAAGELVRDPSLITVEPPPPVEDELAAIAPAPSEVPLRGIQIQFLTRDDAGLGNALAQLRTIPGVEGAGVRGGDKGWSILFVNFRGDNPTLAAAMRARGWSVSDVGDTLRVVPSLAGAVPPNQ